MNVEWLQYLAGILLIIACGACWFGTLLTLPGNWGIVGLAALAAWLAPSESSLKISWTVVGALLVLAVIGEVMETIAGAAGAARLGASRRGMGLSLLGAVVGSVAGVAIGLPIPLPVISSAVAAVLGAGMGAFVGAVLGESWKGRPVDQQLKIGRAALLGRLGGTVAKLVVGIAMIVLVAVNVLF